MVQQAGIDRKTGNGEGDTNYVYTKKKVNLHAIHEHDSMVCNIQSNLHPITHSQSQAVFHSDQ